jgi:hypothetical protein
MERNYGDINDPTNIAGIESLLNVGGNKNLDVEACINDIIFEKNTMNQVNIPTANNAQNANSYAQNANSYAQNANVFTANANQFPTQLNSYAQNTNVFAQPTNPFSTQSSVFATPASQQTNESLIEQLLAEDDTNTTHNNFQPATQPTFQPPTFQPAYQPPTFQPAYQPPAYQPPTFQQPTFQQPIYQSQYQMQPYQFGSGQTTHMLYSQMQNPMYTTEQRNTDIINRIIAPHMSGSEFQEIKMQMDAASIEREKLEIISSYNEYKKSLIGRGEIKTDEEKQLEAPNKTMPLEKLRELLEDMKRRYDTSLITITGEDMFTILAGGIEKICNGKNSFFGVTPPNMKGFSSALRPQIIHMRPDISNISRNIIGNNSMSSLSRIALRVITTGIIQVKMQSDREEASATSSGKPTDADVTAALNKLSNVTS